MKAVIEIEMGNAAFEDTGELSRILRALADKLENRGGPESGDAIRLHDINGNTVGFLHVSD